MLYRKSGAPAPPLYFVSVVPTTSKGKTYHYARLVREHGGKQEVTPLGREGSARHQDWRRRIARRDAIVELEQQLRILDELMQRHQERSHLVDRNFSEEA
jgi:hypothetical protein